MTPLFAEAYADKVILDALERFAPIAAAALVFGLFYWLFRRRAAAREAEKRGEWLKERREKRGAGSKPPPAA